MTDYEGASVYLTDWTGVDYYLSPGCNITETANIEVNAAGAAGGTPVVYVNPVAITHTIRVDGTCTTVEESTGTQGTTRWPYIPRWYFIAKVFSNTGANKWTLQMGDEPTLTGQVKNVTFTRRSGEGNLMDYAITFEVGEIDPS